MDWVSMYTISRCFLGWSDDEFWRATPRKYNAVFEKYLSIKKEISNPQPKALVGEDAFNALSQMVRQAG